ncbi:hypothetical protein B0H15DRAFT_1020792 [Mycena belliarum]|uniref:DUF6697 domain-containing protein n=1 Tax=Mycena belliarum TaxID=1033014 RepID=A0AAD6XT45_9AGAR|nr:hypothetical protein B0H15DRAFT_1020792 [Mycena belliae]
MADQPRDSQLAALQRELQLLRAENERLRQDNMTLAGVATDVFSLEVQERKINRESLEVTHSLLTVKQEIIEIIDDNEVLVPLPALHPIQPLNNVAQLQPPTGGRSSIKREIYEIPDDDADIALPVLGTFASPAPAILDESKCRQNSEGKIGVPLKRQRSFSKRSHGDHEQSLESPDDGESRDLVSIHRVSRTPTESSPSRGLQSHVEHPTLPQKRKRLGLSPTDGLVSSVQQPPAARLISSSAPLLSKGTQASTTMAFNPQRQPPKRPKPAQKEGKPRIKADPVDLPPDVISAYLDDAVPLEIKPPPTGIPSFQRPALNKRFGGGGVKCVITFTKAPLTGRLAVFANPDMNPYLPHSAGAPGLLFSVSLEMTRGGPKAAFSRISHKTPISWAYLGEYTIEVVGKLTPQQFDAQSPAFRDAWAEKITVKKSGDYRAMRARIGLRRAGLAVSDTGAENIRRGSGMPITKDDVLLAFRRGEEAINVVRMTCLTYDRAFVEVLREALTPDRADSDSDSDTPPRTRALGRKRNLPPRKMESYNWDESLSDLTESE